MTEVVIEGARIQAARDFHEELERALELGPYYGRNLDALCDRLSTDVERPITLVWRDAAASQRQMGPEFGAIVAILRRVEEQDEEWGLSSRFKLTLLRTVPTPSLPHLRVHDRSLAPHRGADGQVPGPADGSRGCVAGSSRRRHRERTDPLHRSTRLAQVSLEKPKACLGQCVGMDSAPAVS